MIRMKTVSALLGAAALSALALSMPAKADESLDKLKAQGFARIAIANEPPFTAVKADGTVSGAAPDVARAVFKKLGVNDVVASISRIWRHDSRPPGWAARRGHCRSLHEAGALQRRCLFRAGPVRC